jgi:hypothetical protein
MAKWQSWTLPTSDDRPVGFKIGDGEGGFADRPWPGHDAGPLSSWSSWAPTTAPTWTPHWPSQDSLPEFYSESMAAKGDAGAKPGGGGSSGGSTGGLLTSYVSGDAAVSDALEFNIKLEFSGTWTTTQQAIVVWAAEFLSDLITADAADDTYLGVAYDDLVIKMSTGRIDGSGSPLLGNTLAQTQISLIRDPGAVQEYLPLEASIKLDSTDLKSSITGGWSGSWDVIILHEMIHALGFTGLVFDGLELVDAAGNFIGSKAMAAYGGSPVPIEAGGGTGTAGSHWAESGFAPGGVPMSNELMTGYLGMNQTTYLSDTTIGALADIGYTVVDPSPGAYLVVDSGLLLA